MDTTISMLCDGDRRVTSGGICLASKWIKLADLQKLFEISKIAVIVVKYEFNLSLKEMADKLRALAKQMGDLVISFNEIEPNEMHNCYREKFCNNYRKILHLPLRRKCRWRQRESGRNLEGLSPGIVIYDEYATADEEG